jgi:hypothetical protein
MAEKVKPALFKPESGQGHKGRRNVEALRERGNHQGQSKKILLNQRPYICLQTFLNHDEKILANRAVSIYV